MLLIHKIKVPIYNQDIWIFVGDPYEFQNYLYDIENVQNVEFNPHFANAICLHKDCRSWIWLREDSTIGDLTHELCHAVFDLMEDVGLNNSDQEAFCYLIQYLINECKDIFAIQMDPIKQV
jgi:hypothetical protein